jgi:hypothetical protein
MDLGPLLGRRVALLIEHALDPGPQLGGFRLDLGNPLGQAEQAIDDLEREDQLGTHGLGLGQWPLKAREAALAGVIEDGGEIAIQLLADIRAIFTDSGVDKLSSAVIVQQLAEMEGQPWAEFGRSRKPITQNAMARLLKAYKIAPRTIRTGDQISKGYKRKAFKEAWKRYLPQQGDFDPAHRYSPANAPASKDSHPLHARGVPKGPDTSTWWRSRCCLMARPRDWRSP